MFFGTYRSEFYRSVTKPCCTIRSHMGRRRPCAPRGGTSSCAARLSFASGTRFRGDTRGHAGAP